MASRPRATALPSHARSGSLVGATAQSSALQMRIDEKKVELESLRQMRDLSAGLAEQMRTLQEKISMLNNGTEAVAAVMEKWHTVLRAINIASVRVATLANPDSPTENKELPQTLVRIPIEQTENARVRSDNNNAENINDV